MFRSFTLVAALLAGSFSATVSAGDPPLALRDWPAGGQARPPTAILLPQNLTRQIAEMTTQTGEDGHERGLCLFSEPGGIRLSRVFRGERYTIDLSKQAEACGHRDMIGLVHTHPALDRSTSDIAYRATPSLDDFVQFGFARFASSLVAHQDTVCALLKTPQQQSAKASGDATALVQAYVLSMLREDLPDPGKSSETTFRAVAAAAAARGQGFYCGKNGQALQRIEPREPATSLNRLTLASQALVLGQYLSGNYPYPQPSFNFSPLAERDLARYLNAAIGEKTGIDFTRLDPQQTFEALLAFHWTIDRSIAAVAGSFSVTLRQENARSYSFGCIKGSCTLFTNRNFLAFAPGEDQAVAAFTFTDDGYKSFINLSADERMMYDVVFSNGSSLKYRQQRIGNEQWQPVAGSAEWNFAEGRAVGSIDQGLIAGPVMVYLKDGRVFKGTVGAKLSLSLGERVR